MKDSDRIPINDPNDFPVNYIIILEICSRDIIYRLKLCRKEKTWNFEILKFITKRPVTNNNNKTKKRTLVRKNTPFATEIIDDTMTKTKAIDALMDSFILSLSLHQPAPALP